MKKLVGLSFVLVILSVSTVTRADDQDTSDTTATAVQVDAVEVQQAGTVMINPDPSNTQEDHPVQWDVRQGGAPLKLPNFTE